MKTFFLTINKVGIETIEITFGLKLSGAGLRWGFGPYCRFLNIFLVMVAISFYFKTPTNDDDLEF